MFVNTRRAISLFFGAVRSVICRVDRSLVQGVIPKSFDAVVCQDIKPQCRGRHSKRDAFKVGLVKPLLVHTPVSHTLHRKSTRNAQGTFDRAGGLNKRQPKTNPLTKSLTSAIIGKQCRFYPHSPSPPPPSKGAGMVLPWIIVHISKGSSKLR
jgi:hypothetical protein